MRTRSPARAPPAVTLWVISAFARSRRARTRDSSYGRAAAPLLGDSRLPSGPSRPRAACSFVRPEPTQPYVGVE
ncbi:hypothetical protein [Streptomyces sp. T028]|uniref:hypothetical protein n=1 Tax=Streptomyces sp. T028 TaxID=3394379 RepID=UPI003A8B756A